MVFRLTLMKEFKPRGSLKGNEHDSWSTEQNTHWMEDQCCGKTFSIPFQYKVTDIFPVLPKQKKQKIIRI